MRGPTTGRLPGVAALATVLVAALLPMALAGAPSAAEPTARGGATLDLPTGPVTHASEVAARGTVPPRRSRPVRLQTWRQGSWQVVARAETSRRGRYLLAFSAPRRSGEHRYRVVAPRVRLGDRTYAAQRSPARTLMVADLVSVDVGWRHDCAVADTGDAWCWGDNTYGELGDGTIPTFDDASPTIASHPVQVVGHRWRTVSTGGASTCGVKEDATAWCWGDLATYQFPQDPYEAGTPQQVAGSWAQLAPGAALYWCGVDLQGTGWCQGRNDDGQLGAPAGGQATATSLDGTWEQIVPGTGWEGSATTCGIRTDHSAWCWGAGTQGQLGDGGSADSPVPVEVAGEHQWVSVTVGGQHACGVDTTGTGWCWGHNQDGRLGDGTFVASDVPVAVTVADAWTSIDAGHQHTCGVTASGVGWCWGHNDQAQLGNGESDTVWWPAPAPSRLDGSWTSISAGQTASAGTLTEGTAHAWGEGAFGQLGFGPDEESTEPRHVFPSPVDTT
jgi:alpha-tubulin suppressor-like RCC1 family protein